MGKSLLLEHNNNSTSTTITSYNSIGNFTYFDTSPQSVVEANAQTTMRAEGTLSNLGIIISSNGDATNRTVNFKKNGSNGNMTFSITAGGTGTFTDNSNTDSIVAGDLIVMSIGAVAGTSVTYKATFAVFNPSITADQVFIALGVSSIDTGNPGFTIYFAIPSDPTNLGLDTVESDTKIRLKNAGTLKYLASNVSSNSSAGTTTIGTRINGSNGNISIAITAATTGVFEDSSNTDTVTNTTDFNMYLTYGTGVVNFTCQATNLTYESTNGKTPIYGYAGAYSGSGQNANLTRYVGFARGGTFNTTETNTSQVTSVFATQMSNMSCNVLTNGVTATSTLKFRVNGGNGNSSISITSGATGLFEDASSIEVLTGSENINYQVITGATGTNIRFLWFGIWTGNPSIEGIDTITITESVTVSAGPLPINVNDTIAITEVISTNGQTAISISDSLTVSEHVQLSALQLVDTVTITEFTQMALQGYTNILSVNDSVTIIDTGSFAYLLSINVFDTTSLSEIFVIANTGYTVASGSNFFETSGNRQITRASDGTLYSVFNSFNSGTGNFNIMLAKSTDSGATWVTKFIETTIYGSYTPKIAIDSSDNLHVVWEVGATTNNHSGFPGSRSNNINYKTGTYATLDSDTLVLLTDNPSTARQFVPTLAVDAYDNIHFTWMGFGYGSNSSRAQTVYQKRLANGTFLSITALTDNPGFQWEEQNIAIDRNNDIHIVWAGTWSSASRQQIMYIKYTNSTSTWGSVDTLGNGSSYDLMHPSLAIDGNNKPHITYYSNQSGVGKVVYNNRVSGSWTTKLDLADAEYVSPVTQYWDGAYSCIAFDQANNIYVVFEGREGAWTTDQDQMGIIRYRNGAWQQAKFYTQLFTNASRPGLVNSIYPTQNHQQNIPKLGALGVWNQGSGDQGSGPIYFHKDLDLAFQTDCYILVNDTVTITEYVQLSGGQVADTVTVTESVSIFTGAHIVDLSITGFQWGIKVHP